MDNVEQDAATNESPKKPAISLPFLIVVGVLGVAAFFAAPWIMTQVMLQQENAKAKEIIIPDPEDIQSAPDTIGGAAFGGSE